MLEQGLASCDAVASASRWLPAAAPPPRSRSLPAEAPNSCTNAPSPTHLAACLASCLPCLPYLLLVEICRVVLLEIHAAMTAPEAGVAVAPGPVFVVLWRFHIGERVGRVWPTLTIYEASQAVSVQMLVHPRLRSIAGGLAAVVRSCPTTTVVGQAGLGAPASTSRACAWAASQLAPDQW